MQDLQDIYQDIQNKSALSREPVFIYTGVGTAAGLRNADGTLELKNYHQYPPILQDLKNLIPALKLYIVLLDPCQECPPYMIKDKQMEYSLPEKQATEQYQAQSQRQANIYDDKEKKITVYTLLHLLTFKTPIFTT
jgi:hypothetical protein